MAQRPPRPCTHPGCAALVYGSGAKCPTHRKAYDYKRGSAAQRGYDGDWQRMRAQVLREEPRCQKCAAPSIEVDHIQPIRFAPQLRLVRSNLRGLCKPCHSRRTIADQGANVGKARKT